MTGHFKDDFRKYQWDWRYTLAVKHSSSMHQALGLIPHHCGTNYGSTGLGFQHSRGTSRKIWSLRSSFHTSGDWGQTGKHETWVKRKKEREIGGVWGREGRCREGRKEGKKRKRKRKHCNKFPWINLLVATIITGQSCFKDFMLLLDCSEVSYILLCIVTPHYSHNNIYPQKGLWQQQYSVW